MENIKAASTSKWKLQKLELCVATFKYSETLMEKRKKEMHHFTDEEIAKIMAQIFSGLSYIHSLSIIHRDIKPGIFQLN